MSNTSNILPGTTHVYLPWDAFVSSEAFTPFDSRPIAGLAFELETDNEIFKWIKANCKAQVNLLAYKTDEMVEHYHFCTIDCREGKYADGEHYRDVSLIPNLLWSDFVIDEWARSPVPKRPDPRWLFAFEEASDAVLFKLSFG